MGSPPEHLYIGRDAEYYELLPWEDKIKSVRVAPGCLLNIYPKKNFKGAPKTYIADTPRGLPMESGSVECFCDWATTSTTTTTRTTTTTTSTTPTSTSTPATSTSPTTTTTTTTTTT